MVTLKTIAGYYASRRAISVIIALALAFGVTSILIVISGYNPGEVYWRLFDGGFGSLRRLSLTLNMTTPLLLCSLGLILAFRCGVWNIGAEGQLYMGAVGALAAGLFLPSIPKPLHLLVVAIASFIFGGIWGAIPGILKVKYKANEIITSLLMVFVAQLFVTYLTQFPWRAPQEVAAGFPVTEKVAATAMLPKILPPTALHAGLIIALGLTVVVWFVLQRSAYGYRVKAVGINPDTARYGGIPVGKIKITSMILSGGLAGLAGMAQVSGIFHLLTDRISPGYGFLAILVTFLGGLNPFGSIFVALFLGALLSGSHFAQSDIGIDPSVVHVLVAVIMLSLILLPFIEKRLSQPFKHS
ncbi:MAG: sugar ABC transporter permease [Dehalococcoidales bacterium]|jgi:simple sugar transport system permease protein|nr:sugar ABC transporter permease [Dehalococcoidales bacterium]|tara:strand:+ start:46 stop:1113 length:1068 start_codon:yes stop_codon:yes gene_type:complete